MRRNARGEGFPIELDINEVFRYLGIKSDPDGSMARAVSVEAGRLTEALRPRYVYRVFSAVPTPEGVALQGSGITLPGRTAGQMLAQCRQAALLACTLGAGFEMLMRAAQARDMTRAAILDACGSAWVEAGCAQAERELAARFPALYLTDRFSPGYGDLPLALQDAVCGALDAQKRLGIHVSESCLMNPSKSVTAVIGLSDRPQAARIRGCAFCVLAGTCTVRKGGESCAC